MSANSSLQDLRVVFMGTPEFAADILLEISQQVSVVSVYTQPDKVRSRGKKPEPSAVKVMAEKLNIPVRCLSSFKEQADIEELADLKPDVICVAAFGVILPEAVLAIPPHGCINVHASSLPRWRGAAPIERAILAGDSEVGVCIMRMEEGLDTGDFCVARRLHVGELSATELVRELASLGAQALLTALSQMQEGSVFWTEQDHGDATYACKIEKGELFLNPERTVLDNARRIQASSAGHPAKCKIGDRSVTVIKGTVLTDEPNLADISMPKTGHALYAGNQLMLGTSDGVLCVCSLKPDGKREMTAKEFVSGYSALKQGVLWEAL